MFSSNRFVIFSVGVAVVFAALVFRLVDLQLVGGDDFLDQANDNRFFTQKTSANRGVFLDRYNEPLVWNRRQYFRLLSPEALFSQQELIDQEEALELMATKSGEVAAKAQRVYRFSKSMAHVLGYTGQVTKEELLANDTLAVDDIVGKVGLERVLDSRLRGLAGSSVYEINALGERQRLVSQVTGQDGESIATTLDPYLSQVAQEALGEQKGAAVVMDGVTGEVLAVVSSPSFDPNLMTGAAESNSVEELKARRQHLFNNPNRPFFNRAITGQYPPGSIFKPITSLAGLEAGAMTSATTVLDEGVLKVGEYEYANWFYTRRGGVEGEIALVRALARSNDIYFYKAAEWAGPEAIATMARLFGFGSVVGIETGGEGTGLVPDPAWKEQVMGERWFLGNTYHYGIGQGDLLVTPLQAVSMTQALANHGTLCRPTLLQDQPDRCREVGVLEENLDLVLDGMLAACSAGGTATPLFGFNTNREVGLDPHEQLRSGAIACKTGTAEFGGADEKGFRKTHGWLIAVFDTSKVAERVGSDTQSAEGEEATISAGLRDTRSEDWLAKVKEHGFPERLVVAVVVESDDEEEFKEGTRHAAPVVKAVVEWVWGGE